MDVKLHTLSFTLQVGSTLIFHCFSICLKKGTFSSKNCFSQWFFFLIQALNQLEKWHQNSSVFFNLCFCQCVPVSPCVSRYIFRKILITAFFALPTCTTSNEVWCLLKKSKYLCFYKNCMITNIVWNRLISQLSMLTRNGCKWFWIKRSQRSFPQLIVSQSNECKQKHIEIDASPVFWVHDVPAQGWKSMSSKLSLH